MASLIRTRMTQYLIAGTVSHAWENDTFIAHPFRLGEIFLRPHNSIISFKVLKSRHLLETAIDWRKKRQSSPCVQTAYIAKEAGLSTGRVRQILRLNKLHPKIQAEILSLPPKKAKSRFNERVLRQLVPLSTERQLSQFERILCL